MFTVNLAARIRLGLGLVAVPIGAAVVAYLFRRGVIRASVLIGGDGDAVVSLTALPYPLRFLVVFSGIVVAAAVGRRVERRFAGRIGIGAIAAATRREGAGPALAGTAARTAATFTASGSLASIGREAAVLEAGGALGFATAKVLRLDQDRDADRTATRATVQSSALGAAGLAAAFASTYHAPMAALLFVEEHLGIRRRPLAACAAALGAIVGHVVSLRFLDSTALFAAVEPSARLDVVTGGFAILVPTLLAGRLFRRVRRLITASASRGHTGRWVVIAAGAAASITAFPAAAGNGMDAIRAAGLPTAAVGLFGALAVVKLLATCAVLGSGAPGGVFSPAMAISVGWALLSLDAARRVGLPAPDDLWPVVLAAMAIGIAVGFHAPLVATFAVAEMTGDLRLMPYTAVLVGAAWILNRSIDASVLRFRRVSVRGEPAEAEG